MSVRKAEARIGGKRLPDYRPYALRYQRIEILKQGK